MMMLCIAIAIAVFLPAARPAQASSVTDATSPDAADLRKAGNYCVQKGGEVDIRAPYFNTNADQKSWLRLSGDRNFCKFTSKKDGSRIHVLLSTLYSDKPTMAALAYYAKVPYGGNCHGNPGSCYCSQLGGTDLFGGINLDGGRLVLKLDTVDSCVGACFFPGLLSNDSW